MNLKLAYWTLLGSWKRRIEQSILKKREAIRTMNQGTVMDPSSKVKTPSSYQETDEDERTARRRAILTAELREKQARQRAEDERFSFLQQPQGKDGARKVAEAREAQQCIKKTKTINAGGMTVGKLRTGLSGKRVPSIQGTVLSKRDNVITHLMYPNHRSTVRGIRTMIVVAPSGITLNLMSHAPLRRRVTIGRGRRSTTLPSQG